MKHSKTFQKELPPKVTAWFQKVQEKTAATSEFEFNRDLALMMCRELQPSVSQNEKALRKFVKKILAMVRPLLAHWL